MEHNDLNDTPVMLPISEYEVILDEYEWLLEKEKDIEQEI
jgi:hypothetical protein